MKTAAKKQPPKSGARPGFDALRKPLAPPGHPLSHARPEARAHPAERKVKHKHKVETEPEVEFDDD